MAEKRSGKGCFRCGCFGCLALIVGSIVLSLLMYGIAWMGAQSEEVEDQELTRAIPAAAPAPDPVELGTELEGTISGELPPPVAGRVILDLSSGGFEIEPGRPGEPIRIEASYDTNSYVLEESFEPVSDGREQWLYQVSFQRISRSFLITAIKQAITGSSPEVHIWLPPDVPIELEMRVKQGGATVELGGMWLTTTDLDFEMGGLELAFSEPLQAPVEHFNVRTGMGGCLLGELGNASPRKLDVEYSMGGTVIDLRGEWAGSSDITIRGSMGGGSVFLPDPDDVLIVRGRETPLPENEQGLPVLRIDGRVEMGELEYVQ